MTDGNDSDEILPLPEMPCAVGRYRCHEGAVRTEDRLCHSARMTHEFSDLVTVTEYQMLAA